MMRPDLLAALSEFGLIVEAPAHRDPKKYAAARPAFHEIFNIAL
jgi:hypothetical protein